MPDPMPNSAYHCLSSWLDPLDATTAPLRLLLPIDATERSRQVLQHAIALRAQGETLMVFLLNAAEISPQPAPAFKTSAELAAFLQTRAASFFDEAGALLKQHNIAHEAYFCVGNIADNLAHFAQEYACDAIILPEPTPAWRAPFEHEPEQDLRKHRHGIPIVTVDAHGAEVHTSAQ